MKTLPRILALFLVLAFVLSSFGCSKTIDSSNQGEDSTDNQGENSTSTTQGDSKLAGKKIVVASYMDLTYAQGENQNLDSYYFRAVIHHALDEFCEINDCTWTQLSTKDTTVLASTIAAGQSPDLYFGYGQYPNIASLGLVTDLSSYYDQFSAKYGSGILDVNVFRDGYYAVSLPWNEYTLLGYNRDFFEDNGLKTPRSYFEEGDWNWENFAKVCKSVTLDLNSDGTLDTAAICQHQWSKIFMNVLAEGNDGSVQVVLDTERNRASAQMMYDLYSYGSIAQGNETVGSKVDGKTLVMAIGSYDIYDINGIANQGLNAYNKQGSYIEVVPVPVWKDGDTEYSVSQNFFQFAVPKGADLDFSMAVMDYILEAGVVTEMVMNSGYQFDYTGLRGLTTESAAYLEYLTDRIASEKQSIASCPYYSADYNQKVIDFILSNKISAPRTYMTGLTTRITEDSQNADLWKLPSASSIASISAKLQLLADQYNQQYVN